MKIEVNEIHEKLKYYLVSIILHAFIIFIMSFLFDFVSFSAANNSSTIQLNYSFLEKKNTIRN
jgi:hypothetical protein